MSRRHIVKADNTIQQTSILSARKKAKAIAGESTLSSAWQSLLLASCEIFEFFGDSTTDEEIAELCATTIVSLTSASGNSLDERCQLTLTMNSRMAALVKTNLTAPSNDEEKKERWTKTLELVAAQVNAVFDVSEETKNCAPPNDHDSYSKIYVFILGLIPNSIFLLTSQDHDGGWTYFDTISARFVTAAVFVTAEKFPSDLYPVITNQFHSGGLLTLYFSRESGVTATCITTLVDWVWKQWTHCAFKACEADAKGEGEEMGLWRSVQETLETIVHGALNGEKSQHVSTLVKRVQQALSATLNSPAVASSSYSSSSIPDVNVACCASLELLKSIQGARGAEMMRRGVPLISADEMAITVPLILHILNSSSYSRSNRQRVLYCLIAFIHARVARDELIRLGYLKTILDAILPLLLVRRQKDDLNVSSVFYCLIRSDLEEKIVQLADFPREYIEIDSPQNLIRALFLLIRTEVTKLKEESSSVSTFTIAQHQEYIESLTTWCEALIRAQRATFPYSRMLPLQKSEYMTIELLREMYDYFMDLSARIITVRTSADPNDAGNHATESFASFELRTASVLLCGRLLTNPLVPTSFVQEKITQLSQRMIDDLMQQSPSTLHLDFEDWHPIDLHISIFAPRSQIHTSLKYLARMQFIRPPSYVTSQVSLILRILDSNYGPDKLASLDSASWKVSRFMDLIDQDRTESLSCFTQMIDSWTKEDLCDIPFRVFDAIKSNYTSYFVNSQREAISVVLNLLMKPELFSADDTRAPIRGVDLVFSDDLTQLITSARDFLFDIILHTPNRTVAHDAFGVITHMLFVYGQVVLTRGEVTLGSTTSATSGFASASSSISSSSSSSSTPITTSALHAYTLVCRMFLFSHLPCQNTILRQESYSDEISYIPDASLPHQTLKWLTSVRATNEERLEGQVSQNGNEVKDDQCNDEEDEEPSDNVSLMTTFFITTRHTAMQLSSAQFLSSILQPILPALRRFHTRTPEHEFASAELMHNLYQTLGQEMSVEHRGDMIVILTDCFMAHHSQQKSFGHLKKTAKDILAATEPQLDLIKILPDKEVREYFEHTIEE